MVRGWVWLQTIVFLTQISADFTQIDADLDFGSNAANTAHQRESFCHRLTQMNTDFLPKRLKEICVNQLDKSA